MNKAHGDGGGIFGVFVGLIGVIFSTWIGHRMAMRQAKLTEQKQESDEDDAFQGRLVTSETNLRKALDEAFAREGELRRRYDDCETKIEAQRVRLGELDRALWQSERRATDAEERAKGAEARAAGAEQRAEVAEERAVGAEQRAVEAEAQAEALRGELTTLRGSVSQLAAEVSVLRKQLREAGR